MIDAEMLPGAGMEWLDAGGPFADIVLSTRIRLARNLARRPFGLRAGDRATARGARAVARRGRPHLAARRGHGAAR
jgi:protein-arginine kinase